MDRFEEMTVFVSVAERGNFAVAARQLGLSAPTVTRAVSALEHRLGTLLLARTTRSVRLTEAGARFLEDSRRILAELTELEEAGVGDPQQLRGWVTLTAPQLFGRLYVMPVLRRFLAAQHALRARVLLRDDPVNLHDEGVDLAIRIGGSLPDGLSGETVASVRRVLVAAPALLDRMGFPHRLEQLERYPLIACSIDVGQPHWRFQRDGQDCRVPLAPRLSSTTNDAAIDAAIAGLGVTRVMSYQVAEPLQTGALRIVLEDFEPPPLPVRVLVPEERAGLPRVAQSAAHVAAALRAHPALN